MNLSDSHSARNSRWFWVVLGLIVAFSALTRLATVGHGLPELQVGDENSDLSTALRLTQGELPARHVRYHRGLIAYVNAAAVGGLFGYTYVTGRIGSVDEFRQLYFSERWQFTLATRLVVGGLTVLTIFLTGLAGRHINERAGIFAAAGLALNGFFALNSTYALPDALVTTAIALHLWLTLRVWKHRRSRDYLLAGGSLTFVMLSKLSASPVAIGLLIVHAAIAWEQAEYVPRRFVRHFFVSKNPLLAAVGVAVCNVLFNPLAFLYPDDLRFEITRLGGYAFDAGENPIQVSLILIGQHLVQMVETVWRTLLPLSLLGIAAVIRYRKSVPHWVILSAFALLFLTIASVTTQNYKVFFWMPWIIPMALLSAVGLESLWSWLIRRGWWAAAYGLCLVVALAEGAWTYNLLSKFVQPDTRQQAYQYVLDHWQADTRVMTGEPIAYSIPLRRGTASIERAKSLGAPELQEWTWYLVLPDDERPVPAFDVYGPEMQAVIDTYEDLRRVIEDQHIEYVVETDLCQGFTMSPESESALDFPPISAELRQAWALVAVFSPFPGDQCVAAIDDRIGMTISSALDQQVRPGPIVRIYRVRAAG